MKMNFSSLCCCQLDVYFYDVLLSKASGFIYSLAEHDFLVSNWHVFSGRHAQFGRCLDVRGYTPNRVVFHYTTYDKNTGVYAIKRAECPLVDAAGEDIFWKQDRSEIGEGFQPIVDIALIYLNKSDPAYDDLPYPVLSLKTQLLLVTNSDGTLFATFGYPPVASEVFILGYPHGLTNQGAYPIWKRGSIASEPYYNLNGNVPVIYVDAATRQGMSGSPVIYRGTELRDMNGGNSTPRTDLKDDWLVGVYAGRDGSIKEENEISIGRVWRAELVTAIAQKGLQDEANKAVCVNQSKE